MNTTPPTCSCCGSTDKARLLVVESTFGLDAFLCITCDNNQNDMDDEDY